MVRTHGMRTYEMNEQSLLHILQHFGEHEYQILPFLPVENLRVLNEISWL